MSSILDILTRSSLESATICFSDMFGELGVESRLFKVGIDILTRDCPDYYKVLLVCRCYQLLNRSFLGLYQPLMGFCFFCFSISFKSFFICFEGSVGYVETSSNS